jgi:hypothetical protein
MAGISAFDGGSLKAARGKHKHADRDGNKYNRWTDRHGKETGDTSPDRKPGANDDVSGGI